MSSPQHDPERDAAAYLCGDLAPTARASFEAHLVGCDACWSEVTEARTGRALAEGLRVAAPQDLRELLRAIASTTPDAPAGDVVAAMCPSRPRHWAARPVVRRAVALAATVVVLGIGVAVLGPQEQNPQASLVAAASEFEAEPLDGAPAEARPPVPAIGTMTYQGAVAKPLAGQPALVYRYADGDGHRVLLMSSTVDFPRAANAEPIDAMGKDWIASVDGVQILCADYDGLSWLVISDSREEAVAAGRAAGLT